MVCVVFLLSLQGFDRVSLESAARFFGLALKCKTFKSNVLLVPEQSDSC